MFPQYRKIKLAIMSVAKTLLPTRLRLPVKYIYLKCLRSLDDEMLAIDSFLTQTRRFVDIGANTGIYSYHFSKTFDHVDAFEPIGEITTPLKSLRLSSISVHNIALSDHFGSQLLHIPVTCDRPEAGLASLEHRDGPCEHRVVSVRPLDSFNFHDADLIKIDVEGHELDVLHGAIATIQKSKPVFIIEIEQRHIRHSMQEVFDFFFNAGYQGWFMLGATWRSVAEFTYMSHQAPYVNNVSDPRYVNNFVFISAEKCGPPN